MRNYEVYTAPCVDCGHENDGKMNEHLTEVESRTLPVPLRCAECQAKHDKSMLKDRPAPVRSTSGG